MPRFVILAHDWPTPHWDLLLEAGPVLMAWRLLAEPGGLPVSAEPNVDHRLVYLDYEGPVSGGRGTVIRWDFGTFDGDIGGPEWRVRWNGGKSSGWAEMRDTPAGWRFGVG
ncbi:MAG: DNA polymerase ligase N-terminal domain-containing protein [Fimbriiglobus sp.]